MGMSRELPWWTRGSALNLLFVFPMLLVVFWAGDSDLSGLTVRSRSFLTAWFIALCLGLVLISAMGAWLGENVRPRVVLQIPDEQLIRVTHGLGLVALATYVFWYRSLIFNPPLMLGVLTGAVIPDRNEIGTVVGITSLVNLQPLFFSLAGYVLFVRKRKNRALKALTAVLLLATLFRAYVWSERLAVAEAVVTLALALLLAMPAARPDQRVRSLIVRLGPYAALPGVFLFFALAEFFRSWSFYQDRLSFWDFALGRFVSYYYTSLNNGAGLLATMDWPTWKFENVLSWLHTFPMGIGPLFSEVVDMTEYPNQIFLQRYADPEFSTSSSFAGVTMDLGVTGAILYYFVSMFCGGILYARFVKGDLLGVMLYPSVLIALFESFRYCYWGTSRAFVWFAGSMLVLAVLWACGAIGAGRATPGGAARSPSS